MEGGIIKQHRELVTLGSVHDDGVLTDDDVERSETCLANGTTSLSPLHIVYCTGFGGCRLERTTLSQLHWMPRLTSLLDPTFPEEKNAAHYSQ